MGLYTTIAQLKTTKNYVYAIRDRKTLFQRFTYNKSDDVKYSDKISDSMPKRDNISTWFQGPGFKPQVHRLNLDMM